MKWSVEVSTGASKGGVEKLSDNQLRVRLRERPMKGEANKALIGILSGFFKVPKSRISICSGFRSKRKIIEVKSG